MTGGFAGCRKKSRNNSSSRQLRSHTTTDERIVCGKFEQSFELFRYATRFANHTPGGTSLAHGHRAKERRRYLIKIGEPTDLPGRSPSRGPPYWKSVVLRHKMLGGERNAM
jgi:hypothetical protein